MAKSQQDSIVDINKPLPGTAFPWVMIFFLLAAIVMLYLWALRGPDKLIGPPLPKNEYIEYMQKPAVKPQPKPAAQPPAGAVTETPAETAPAQPQGHQ